MFTKGALSALLSKIRFYAPYILLIIALFLCNKVSFLFFHTTVEVLAFTISVSLFILIWNTRKIIQNNFLFFLSVVYFFVGIVNFFHFLSYKGMPIFSSYGDTLSSQLWLGERFLLAASFPIALLFVNRQLNRKLTLFAYAVITCLILASIFFWKIIPVTFIDGKGLTPFKVYSSYVVITLFLIGVFLIFRYREKFNERTYRLLTTSLIFNIIAELMFTNYTNLNSLVVVIAHIIVLFSYYFVYKAIIELGLTDPYSSIFHELQELNKRKDELLSVTTHELKNPFTVIKLYSQLLEKELEQRKKDEKISHYVRQVNLQTSKINYILNDLNDIAKISSGQMTVEKKIADLAEFLNEAMEGFRLRYPKRKFNVKISKVPLLSYDEERIGQVIENLVSNAVKYSRESTPVNIKLETVDNRVVFSVRDRGMGIEEANRKKIFDKYYRADNGHMAQGLGLGLYISKEIISRHQGKIGVESEPKKGSLFYFSLPINGASSKHINNARKHVSKGSKRV